MTSLKIYNTLSKQKEVFVPLDSNHIGMYVCGPTVYDFAHLGNARPIVVFDVLYRLLKYFYPKVSYVRNITDVDDKINAAAKEANEPISTITQRTIQAFHDDIAQLNALPPTLEPRATTHIPPMIDMIQILMEKGYAYESKQHVLFRHQKFEKYGHLSRKSLEDMVAGARVEVAPYKENPGDFVLWKPSFEGDPGWESPWGFGRPGWHIECSAMSKAYLGETFDIHGGGIDLVFPHHDNEIAQSCAAHGTEHMAKYWMHNGHLMVQGSKMSKSLGNFLTVRQLLADYDGEVIRLALLSTHYRQPLDFQSDTLSRAKTCLDRLYRVLNDARDSIKDALVENVAPDDFFMKALFDDLNTPQALSILYDYVSHYNKEPSLETALKIKVCAEFLGLLQRDPVQWFHEAKKEGSLSDGAIAALIQKRQEARKNKDFKTADDIRTQLEAHHIILEDTAQGVQWRRG